MSIRNNLMRHAGYLFLLMLLSSGVVGCGRRPLRPEGRLQQAQQLMQQAQFGDARDLLLEISGQQPQSLTTHVNLAIAYWRLGDVTAAAAALNRATEISPQNPIVWQLHAQLLIQTGNPEGAIEVLEQFPSSDAAPLTLRSIAEQLSGKPETALFYLEKALVRDPYYAPALYNMAILQRDAFNSPVEAIAAWRRFRETDPQNPRAMVSETAFVGELVSTESQPNEPSNQTVASLPESISTVPSVTNATETASTEEMDQDHASADANATTHDQSANIIESSPSPPPKGIKTLLAKAQREIAAGNNDSALVTLKEAVQKYPDNADAVWTLAVFYDKNLGLKDRAKGLYKTFLDMFPNDPRAKTILETAQEATAPPPPSNTQGHETNFFQQGLAHYGRQEWDAAIAAYRQALSMDPKSESCAYNLGLAYKAKNDLDAAAAAFRHALNINPDMIKSLYMMGLTEIQRQRNADALVHLNRLIHIQPDFAKAHYLLGTVYQNENQVDTAAHHFERFLELDPNNKAADQVTRWLEQYRR